MLNIVIGADICPIEGNAEFFFSGNAEVLLHDLLPDLQQADLAIANLECPLIAEPSPIRKTGPTFGAPGEAINGIRAAGIDLLCLANNHILDHGASGLANTTEVCRAAGIATVGAGESLAAARQIFIREIGAVRIGVLAAAEQEFSTTSGPAAGANPLDIIDLVRNIKENESRFDYLIIHLHGSAEFHAPTPRIKEICHFLVEMGANAVIVQHPHCLGGYEDYLGAHIVYGQGALLMDEAIYRGLSSFHEGFLVKLLIGDDFASRMEIIPFIQSSPAPGARRLPPEKEDKFRASLAKRSEAIKQDAFVQEEWLRFVEKRKHGYISSLLGHNRILRELNKNGFVMRFLHGSRPLLGVRNIVTCETHREAVETIFKRGLL